MILSQKISQSKLIIACLHKIQDTISETNGNEISISKTFISEIDDSNMANIVASKINSAGRIACFKKPLPFHVEYLSGSYNIDDNFLCIHE